MDKVESRYKIWLTVALMLVVAAISALIAGYWVGNRKESTINDLENKVKNLEDQLLDEGEIPLDTENLFNLANLTVQAIRDMDMQTLSELIHNEKGLRFSQYGYIDVSINPLFTKEQVLGLLEDEEVRIWGHYDGIGDPIELTFSDYYSRFVYDVDFADPHIIGNNFRVGHGNSLNNISDVFPEGVFIEYHFTGFHEEFLGMDWRSLRLIFEEDESGWHLVGILHDQWTI